MGPSLPFRNPSRHPGLGAHPNSDLPKADSDLELPGEVSEPQSGQWVIRCPAHTLPWMILSLFHSLRGPNFEGQRKLLLPCSATVGELWARLYT